MKNIQRRPLDNLFCQLETEDKEKGKQKYIFLF